MGIGFGIAVVYSVVSNIVFLWRAWKRSPMPVGIKPPRYNFLLGGGYSTDHRNDFTNDGCVILSTYGENFHGEAGGIFHGCPGTLILLATLP